MRKDKICQVSLAVVLLLVLSGCAMPTPQVVEIEKPVVVEKPVVQTVVVEREVVVEKPVVQTVVVEREIEKIVTATPEPTAKPRSIILLYLFSVHRASRYVTGQIT